MSLNKIHPKLNFQLISFCMVGVAGFVVDAAVLMILNQLFQWPVISSRFVSFTLATLTTWMLNRSYVFSSDENRFSTKKIEYFRYLAVQTVGAGLNLFIFLYLLTKFPLLNQLLFIPLGVGALIALIFNYLANKHFVFNYGEILNE